MFSIDVLANMGALLLKQKLLDIGIRNRGAIAGILRLFLGH
jgi:hypothetical protein